jgi:hypothetical protein
MHREAARGVEPPRAQPAFEVLRFLVLHEDWFRFRSFVRSSTVDGENRKREREERGEEGGRRVYASRWSTM